MNASPASNEKQPTAHQLRVMRWIADYFERHQYRPTFKELAREFDWSGNATAQENLERLYRNGWVTWERGLGRTLRLTRRGEEVLEEHRPEACDA